MFNAKDPRNLDEAYRLTYIGSGLVFNYNGILTPNASQAAANTNLTPSLTYTGNAQTSIMYFSGDSSSLSSNVFLNGSYYALSPGNEYFQSLEITGGVLKSVYYSRSNAISFGANLTGLVIQSTDGSSNVFAMRNGVEIGTSSLVGTVPAYPIYLGALNILNTPPYFPCSNLQISFYANTTFLTSAEAQTLSTIINTFQTSLGRNTY